MKDGTAVKLSHALYQFHYNNCFRYVALTTNIGIVIYMEKVCLATPSFCFLNRQKAKLHRFIDKYPTLGGLNTLSR